MAHIRQSRPDYSLGFQVKVLNTFEVVPSSLDSGADNLVAPRDSKFVVSLISQRVVPRPLCALFWGSCFRIYT